MSSTRLKACLSVTALALLLHGIEARAQAGAQPQQQPQRQQQDEPGTGYTVKPDWLAFGYRTLETSHTDTFWLRNKDNRPLRIQSVELRGNDAASFSVKHNCGTSVPVEGQCRIDVTFRPTSPGDKQAELRVVAGNNEIRTRGLTGVGARLSWSVEPSELRFGRVQRDATSAPQKVTIKNTGGGLLPLRSMEVTGQNPQQFSISDDCPEHVVPENRDCTVTVVFKPTWRGTDKPGDMTANLVITPGGEGEPRTVTLRGTAQ